MKMRRNTSVRIAGNRANKRHAIQTTLAMAMNTVETTTGETHKIGHETWITRAQAAQLMRWKNMRLAPSTIPTMSPNHREMASIARKEILVCVGAPEFMSRQPKV